LSWNVSESWNFSDEDPFTPGERIIVVDEWDLTEEDPAAPTDDPVLGGDVQRD
jgi:hypothetical protein